SPINNAPKLKNSVGSRQSENQRAKTQGNLRLAQAVHQGPGEEVVQRTLTLKNIHPIEKLRDAPFDRPERAEFVKPEASIEPVKPESPAQIIELLVNFSFDADGPAGCRSADPPILFKIHATHKARRPRAMSGRRRNSFIATLR